MTVSEFARLVAQMDRLWFGAGLTEAMKGDQVMFHEWYELLEHIDAAVARRAVQELNAEPGRNPPTPGQIARRAGEIGSAKFVALPDHALRDPTPEEIDAAHRRLPELRAVIAAAARAGAPERRA